MAEACPGASGLVNEGLIKRSLRQEIPSVIVVHHADL